jgi:hypothetical protein
MEEPEIKPCPFCGSVGKLEEVESEDGYRFDVYCTNVQYCGGTTSRCRSAAKAIEFWNQEIYRLQRVALTGSSLWHP